MLKACGMLSCVWVKSSRRFERPYCLYHCNQAFQFSWTDWMSRWRHRKLSKLWLVRVQRTQCTRKANSFMSMSWRFVREWRYPSSHSSCRCQMEVSDDTGLYLKTTWSWESWTSQPWSYLVKISSFYVYIMLKEIEAVLRTENNQAEKVLTL
jgi:hypothetical protein